MINDLWYKNAVIYCLSIGTYLDTDGDGIGDFQGARRPSGLPARARRDGYMVDALSALSR